MCEEAAAAAHSAEIDLKCGEKVTDSDSEGHEREYVPTHHDHTRRPKPIKARYQKELILKVASTDQKRQCH